MLTFIIVIHAVVCAVLIALVLIQRGRGSGLVESFSGVESMFGTKTNAFLTRTTTILSVLFFLTCLSLAVLSVRQSKSLMSNVDTQAQVKQAAQEVPSTEQQPQAPVKQEKTQEVPKAE